MFSLYTRKCTCTVVEHGARQRAISNIHV
jgi:hypothetical protein